MAANINREKKSTVDYLQKSNDELLEELCKTQVELNSEKREWIELTMDLIDKQYPSNEDKLRLIEGTLSRLAKERAQRVWGKQ